MPDLLVTGARGFVGRHLVERGRAAGLEVATFAGDLREPVPAIDAAAVVHLARSTAADPWAALEDDLRMAGNLVKALPAGAALLVPGSAAQYGMGLERPLREEDPTQPLTAYAAAKCALERALTAQPLTGEVRVIWARAFNHAGPGQGQDAPIAQWAAQVAAGSRTLKVGNLDVVRDFLDVRDVADAYLALLRAPEARGVVNVCSGVPVRLSEVCERLVAAARAPVEVVRDDALTRRVDPPFVVGDPSRLRALTNWTPRIALERTLAEMLDERRAPAEVTV